MQMMMLAATQGTKIEITANGADAKEAVATLVQLVKSGFQED
jgi:phosphotransferase system HPr (HPr) family protein